jgi:hypothetical protein
MQRIQLTVLLASAAVLVACCGCTRWKKPVDKAPDSQLLSPVKPSRDGAVLEIFFATFPADADATLNAIWKEADEQKYTSELCRRLANHGFRVGTTASPAPAAIEQLLRSKTSGADGTIARLDTEPTVSRKLLNLQFESAGQILASEVEPRVPLLQFKNGKLRGRDFFQAQGLFSIVTKEADAGRVSIELTPELHHGEAAQRWTGRDGRFVMESNRPKEVFADAATHTRLAPGDVLLVGGRADRPGSLGHLFFSREVAGQQQRRLLVIRVKSLGR